MPIEVNTNVNNLVDIEVSTTSQETPEITVQVPDVIIDVDTTVLLGPKGNKGDTGSTGVITGATASINNSVGIPSVSVISGGTPEARSFNFVFNNLKGEPGTITGATASVDANVGTPSVTVTNGGTSEARSFDFAFSNLKGVQGDRGPSAVVVSTTEPTDEDVKIWLNPNGTQGKISQLTDDTATYPVDKADTLTGLTASITELNYTDGVTSNIQTQLNGKEDTISDLSTIRSGAEAGATAVQPSDLSTVATTGDYDDLTNKPTIPTVNNATLTIQKNGSNVQTFTANASSDVTCNITVPTDLGDLTNNAGYTKNIGTVTSVNNVSPINGNVSITIPTDTGDLTNNAGFITSSALSGYATETWVGNQGYITQAVDDTSTTSTTLGWSASKLNGIIGDLETILASI